MTLAASTTAQIRTQVELIHKHRPDERIIGIRTDGQWAGAEFDRIAGKEFRFVQCDSTLEIRERLLEFATDGTPLVIITNLNDTEIGLDLLVRFARRRLHTLRPWPIVQELFQARLVDPSLLAKRWLAEALLESVPPQGYKPVPSGTLNQETVWAIILRERIGLNVVRPDARDLLSWSLVTENIARYLRLPAEMREGVQDWIRHSAGSIADLIIACVDAGYGEDAAPVGLACQVVFSGDEPELREAAVRLERFTGSHSITWDEARLWADAAAELVKKGIGELSSSPMLALLERSDQIIREIRADAFAYSSPYSLAGFEMRLERFGRALDSLLQGNAQSVPDELLALAEDVFAHNEARLSRERVSRVEMAIRLLRWLVRQGNDAIRSFVDAANHYLREGGFVDRARYMLDGGDSVGILVQAYARLAKMATTRREAENKQFAELLANWTEAGSVSDAVLCVEDLLREVVVKVTQSRPVLLVVIDGMSMAVFSELIEDVAAKGWLQWGEDATWPRPIISALPSVTAVSRTSLFCGRLASGSSKDEIVGFSKNPELVRVCRAGYPPLLFHKASLSETSGLDLAADVRKEIASEKRKIVAVVVNVVDDHLTKGDQLAVPWTLRHMPVLEQLLYAARDSSRAVILTSDHGHVFERQTIYRKGEPGERYRTDDSKPLGDELVVAGSRVLGPAGNCMIAPWSEAVRYAVKKHGYHGGLTPQECIIPLAILTRQGATLSGWTQLSYPIPEWWNVLYHTGAKAEELADETEPIVEPTSDELASVSSVKADARFPLLTISENEVNENR
jgi:PglZ domain-containing protein